MLATILLSIAGFAATIMAGVLLLIWSSIERATALWIIAVCLFVIIVFGGLGLFLNHSKEEKPVAQSNTGDGNTIIQSFDQRGGITAHTVNIGNQRLKLTEQLGRELAAQLPTGKPVLTTVIGSQADVAVADQIEQFLREQGFTVQRHAQLGSQSPPPDHKLFFQEQPTSVSLLIAPSAQE